MQDGDEQIIVEAQQKCEEGARKAAARQSKTDPHPLGEDGRELLDGIWEGMKVQHARENGIPVGKAICEHCSEIREWGDPPSCDCEKNAERREAERQREQKAREVFEHVVPPGMQWARLGSDRFTEKVAKPSPRMAKFAERWGRHVGSLIIWGPTGMGKTAATVAVIHRLLEETKELSMPYKRVRWAYGIRYIKAADLVVARRNSRLGGEADIIEQANEASLLVLDELGFEEPYNRIPHDVLDKRYDGGNFRNKPTIVTTGRKYREFVARYGSSFVRRVSDRGHLINLWHPPNTPIEKWE